MSNTGKTVLSWSSGKDAAMTLDLLKQEGSQVPELLLTTVTKNYDRVTMHGLRKELLHLQAKALQLPLMEIELQESSSMEVYENAMSGVFDELRKSGFSNAAYGDIFLEDLKKYRDEQMAPFGIKGLYPLWQKDSRELFRYFLQRGFKAVVVSAKDKLLGESFAGRELDLDFLNDLPASVDPCGENGEFHTFCYDGPIFNQPVEFIVGEKTLREYPNPEGKGSVGFWFCDLIPA